MRILIYNWKDLKHPQVGGAEIITHQLAKRLVKRGHQVSWFCRSFSGAAPEDRYNGIEVIRRGGLLTTYWQGWRYYRSLKEKPDLVIDMVNTLCWQTPIYVGSYVDQRKVIAYVNQLAAEVFYYQLPWPLAGFAYQLEPLQFIAYRKVPFVCYADSTKQDLAKLGIPAKNIGVFTLGLDHSRYSQGRKSATPLFVTLGRLVKMKRNDLVIKAMKQVVQELPDAQLKIIGDGPEKTALKRLVSRLGLSRSITIADKDVWFFSKSAKDQKAKLLQAAWTLVIPSVKEGWGMVVTEAAACGTPSIGTDVTGLRDSIKYGRTGLLVSANPSVDELAGAMIKMARDKTLRERLSRNAVRFAKTLDWDRSFEQLVGAVKRVSGVQL